MSTLSYENIGFESVRSLRSWMKSRKVSVFLLTLLMVMHHPSNTLQTLNKQPSMAFSEVTKYQNTTSIITFMYFSRATVEAIMLFVCPCEYIRMCRLHTYTDSSSPQLMSSFTPFPFKVQTTSFRDAKLQSLLSISGFPRPVSPPDLSEPSVGGFQMRTQRALSQPLV